MLKIGVMPSSFRIPFKDAVIKARDMGAKGLQPYVTSGELDPDNLSSDDRRDISGKTVFDFLLFAPTSVWIFQLSAKTTQI